MYSIENKSEESRAIQNNSEKHESIAQFKDNRSLSAVEVGGNTVQLEKKENLTGMPDNLKEGIESLSGFFMDDVRVHYNSSKPATVQALAYTQGTDIHVAPGQEKHLPHEAWHVAQQMAGRVSPTTNINEMPVNDNAELEHEADVMGEKAVMQRKTEEVSNQKNGLLISKDCVQRISIKKTQRKFRDNHLWNGKKTYGADLGHRTPAAVLKARSKNPNFPGVNSMVHIEDFKKLDNLNEGENSRTAPATSFSYVYSSSGKCYIKKESGSVQIRFDDWGNAAHIDEKIGRK